MERLACAVPGAWLPATIVAGLVATGAITAHAMPVPADHDCMGRWVGRGRNTGHATWWTIDLTLSASPDGGRCGTVEYTNPDCGGTLEGCTLVGEDIHTRESYSHTSGRCAPAGQVIIRCEGDRMRYSWIGWERVDSILHRPEGSGSGQPPEPGGTTPPPPGTTRPPGTTPPPGSTPAPGEPPASTPGDTHPSPGPSGTSPPSVVPPPPGGSRTGGCFGGCSVARSTGPSLAWTVLLAGMYARRARRRRSSTPTSGR